ncbi:GTP 3',8-cyclase MoaA [Rhodococcus sp. NPDC059968]|uniref:GTP 3',8-cyclase MoaA n=1 Tax=Rhodococcus sp. NPDC059968 TaxID=3347017 RepID=UPI00366B01D1
MATPTQPVATDTIKRPLRDLRISVTDRCNFRCRYCMPREVFGPDHTFLKSDELLTFREIVRITEAGIALGVRKVRLTGGEPLMRRGIDDLVRSLSQLGDIDLAMTTNGVLLPRLADRLADSGLKRVNISLDSLDDSIFHKVSDSVFTVRDVLAGISAAEDAGLAPIKVNAVIRRGLNEGSVLPLAEHFRGTPHVLRFIEYMDVGATNGWNRAEVVPAADILETISRVHPLDAVPPSHPGEVATRYRYRDGSGEIGVISSVSQPFCGSCSRARISADGTMYTCLFASAGVSLRDLARSESDDVLRGAMARAWSIRDDRYSELRATNTPRTPRIEMSYIGG